MMMVMMMAMRTMMMMICYLLQLMMMVMMAMRIMMVMCYLLQPPNFSLYSSTAAPADGIGSAHIWRACPGQESHKQT